MRKRNGFDCRFLCRREDNGQGAPGGRDQWRTQHHSPAYPCYPFTRTPSVWFWNEPLDFTGNNRNRLCGASALEEGGAFDTAMSR